MKKRPNTAKSWKNPLFVENAGTRHVAEALRLGERLRRKAARGLALGTFVIELPAPATLSTLALAGFDFVVLDLEHSAIDFSRLEQLIFAAHAAGLPALVRTWGEDTGRIGKVLDMGANGIMAPHVDTPQRARAIVEQARFAPLGHRGFSPLTQFDALREPLRTLSQTAFVVIQIEGRKALDRVSQIAAVPGIDSVFVGPYDLALSLDVTPGSPQVFAAAERVRAAVPEDVGMGIYLDDPAKSGTWAARGFSLQCVSFDGRMLAKGARAIVDEARRSAPKRRGRRS